MIVFGRPVPGVGPRRLAGAPFGRGGGPLGATPDRGGGPPPPNPGGGGGVFRGLFVDDPPPMNALEERQRRYSCLVFAFSFLLLASMLFSRPLMKGPGGGPNQGQRDETVFRWDNGGGLGNVNVTTVYLGRGAERTGTFRAQGARRSGAELAAEVFTPRNLTPTVLGMEVVDGMGGGLDTMS